MTEPIVEACSNRTCDLDSNTSQFHPKFTPAPFLCQSIPSLTHNCRRTQCNLQKSSSSDHLLASSSSSSLSRSLPTVTISLASACLFCSSLCVQSPMVRSHSTLVFYPHDHVLFIAIFLLHLTDPRELICLLFSCPVLYLRVKSSCSSSTHHLFTTTLSLAVCRWLWGMLSKNKVVPAHWRTFDLSTNIHFNVSISNILEL